MGLRDQGSHQAQIQKDQGPGFGLADEALRLKDEKLRFECRLRTWVAGRSISIM